MRNSNSIALIWTKFPTRARVLKEVAVFSLIQLLVLAPQHAAFWKKNKASTEKAEPIPMVKLDQKKVLSDSFISYRAVGGFTGVQSYSVLISCVDGRISVMKTIHDPKSSRNRPTLRQRDSMDTTEYLALWEDLEKQRVFGMEDAPNPKLDIFDEFTFHFEAKVGDHSNTFSIYGLSRPEGARYFAVKTLIDDTAGMASLWNQHEAVARR